MKKLVTIFFLAIYLLATTDSYQLLKLPMVFQHFSEHRAENKNLGFFDFLDMHYLHGSPQDADFDRDMQLPFKKACTDCASFSVTAAFVPLVATFSIEKPIRITEQNNYIIQEPLLFSSYLATIWQPPKLA
ncbi:hypothetical protein ACFOW1_03480 [Parasediminibacterium paludis]|uniref:DUF2946 domain-containing protein n=1 Tax=Parasediminibacterium paludis TaxID=908966 RepID=A0ABV8PS05_9BACT